MELVQQAFNSWRLHCLIGQLRSIDIPNRELFEKLRHAWGNEGFSADVTYMIELAARVMRCSGPILECGSGLTTVVAAVLAGRRNLEVWSLEQDNEWVRRVQREIQKNGIRNVLIRYAPLRKYYDFVWYDIDQLELPKRFDLILCDGPAVFDYWGEAHSQWRYGLLPVLTKRGVNVADILLDDATEARAENLLRRWHVEFGMKHSIIHTVDGDCAVVSGPGVDLHPVVVPTAM